MNVGVLDHFNIRTRDLKATVRFYEDILGLENGARPNFAFPGAWLYSEGRAVVHLVDISPTEEPQKPDSGVVHHVAFISRDLRRAALFLWITPFDAAASSSCSARFTVAAVTVWSEAGAWIVRCPPFRLGIWKVLYLLAADCLYRMYETPFGLKSNSFATSLSDVAAFRLASLDMRHR